MAAELAEVFVHVLGWFNPKRRSGKILWTVLALAIIAVALIEVFVRT